MSKVYYINATAPFVCNVGGRLLRLGAGESWGPISQVEYDQLCLSADRSRFHAVGTEVQDEVIARPAFPEDSVPLYGQPVTSTSSLTLDEDLGKQLISSVVEVNPRDYTAGVSPIVEEGKPEPVIKTPEVDVDEQFSCATEPLVESLNLTEEKVVELSEGLVSKPVDVAPASFNQDKPKEASSHTKRTRKPKVEE